MTDAAAVHDVGPYRIVTRLGEGSGGTVYRAWDPRLAREVALKILHERPGGDAKRAHRFIAEARAASALNHPNIVTVLDAAFDTSTPYIVSELIDGRTLREEIGSSPIPPKRLLDLATQIADGLSAAHDAGIVHRDLKPENIMITRSGRVKIVDFGLASPVGFEPAGESPIRDDSQTRTDLGLRAGTIPYMSPEQARGVASDYRSDQFSLGLILFEMAVGRPAFRRDTPAATLDAIINDELPQPSALDARMPPMFRWIVERCLAKERGERYASTTDLHRDLRTLRDRFGELASRAQAQSSPARRPLWKRSLLAPAVLAAFVAGAVLSVMIAAPVGTRSRRVEIHAVHNGPWIPGVPGVVTGRSDHRVRGRRQRHAADFHAAGVVAGRGTDHTSPVRLQVSILVAGREPDLLRVAGSRPGEHLVGRRRWRNASGGRRECEPRRHRARRPDARLSARRAAGGYRRRLRAVAADVDWRRNAIRAVRSAALRRGRSGVLARRQHARDQRRAEIDQFAAGGARLAVLDRADVGAQPYRRFEWWSDVMPRVTSFAWLPDSRHLVLAVTSMTTPGSHLWTADLQPGPRLVADAQPRQRVVSVVVTRWDADRLCHRRARLRRRGDVAAGRRDALIAGHTAERIRPRVVAARHHPRVRHGSQRAGRNLAAEPRRQRRRSSPDHPARLRRRSDDHARLAQLLTRRPADRVPAQREQTDLAAEDLDLADRGRASGSTGAPLARGLPGRADLVSGRPMDRVHGVDRPPMGAGEGARRKRRRADRPSHGRHSEREPVVVAERRLDHLGNGSGIRPRFPGRQATARVVRRPLAGAHVVQ